MIVTLTAEKIHTEISELLIKGYPYIDALIEYSHKNGIEIETIAEIVKKSTIIKEKVRDEALTMKLLKNNETTVFKLCD